MKIVIKIILILISAFCILMNIGPVITSGEKNIGIIVGLGLGGIFLIYALLFDRINHIISLIWHALPGKILLIISAALILICVTIGTYTLANVMRYSRQTDKHTEYIIVLGCQVNGTSPGRYLRARINKAYEYLCANPESKAILSGGQGRGEDISEGQCMFNSLTSMGIDGSRLLIDDKSSSTIENFENSVKNLENKGVILNEIIIVTNDFHEYRASRVAQKNGITAYPYPAKTPWNGYLPFAVREVFAISYQIYLGRNNLRN
jgi:uncharacterized SAM-binding protein YcdF (DUF218 family)